MEEPALEASITVLDGVSLKVVQHGSTQLMRDHLKQTIKGIHRPDEIQALTVAERCNDAPVITVYMPVMDEDTLQELVPHEATHVALAIIRNRLFRNMDVSNQLLIAQNQENGHVSEEQLAVISGGISAGIHKLLLHIECEREGSK